MSKPCRGTHDVPVAAESGASIPPRLGHAAGDVWDASPSRCVEPPLAHVNGLTIATPYVELLRRHRLDSLDALLAVPGQDRLDKPGLDAWRERIRLTLEDDGASRTFFLKRYRNPPRGVARHVRRSGTGAVSLAGVEWEWMRRLAADGLPCPRAVAFGEALRDGHEVRSVVLMEEVPGRSLESRARQWADGDRAAARVLIARLAALIGRFHALGYVHRDLYLSHIFHDPTQPPDRSLHLIDLQRVIRPRGRRLRWIIKDLASLNFSTPQAVIGRTDRLRWLTQYLGRRRLDQSARRLVYAIIGKTQRIARHDARRGRR